MGDLTWNQRRALTNMLARGAATAVTPREISDPFAYFRPYLCGSAARSALMSLARKGLVEVNTTSPLRYLMTDAGRRALSDQGERE